MIVIQTLAFKSIEHSVHHMFILDEENLDEYKNQSISFLKILNAKQCIGHWIVHKTLWMQPCLCNTLDVGSFIKVLNKGSFMRFGRSSIKIIFRVTWYHMINRGYTSIYLFLTILTWGHMFQSNFLPTDLCDLIFYTFDESL